MKNVFGWIKKLSKGVVVPGKCDICGNNRFISGCGDPWRCDQCGSYAGEVKEEDFMPERLISPDKKKQKFILTDKAVAERIDKLEKEVEDLKAMVHGIIGGSSLK